MSKTPKFSRRFFKNQLLREFGDTPATRIMMSLVDLSMKEDEKYTLDDYHAIFSPLAR